MIGVSAVSLRKRIRELGIERKEYSKKNKLNIHEQFVKDHSREEVLAALVRLGKQNLVAEEYGINPVTFKKALRLYGITSDDYPSWNLGRPTWNAGTMMKHVCPMCGEQFAYPRATRKHCSLECSRKAVSIINSDGRLVGEKNPNFGNGDKVRQRWKEGAYDHVKRHGEDNPNWGNGHVLSARWKAGDFDGRKFSEKEFTKGKATVYNGVTFRSSWEADFAEDLDKAGIEWVFEPCRFPLSSGKKYVPDFYTPHNDTYYEVKGAWWPYAKDKFELFKSEYPNIKIEIKGSDWWKSRQQSDYDPMTLTSQEYLNLIKIRSKKN